MDIKTIVQVVVGLVLIVTGALLTFKPKLNYQKESV